MAEYSEYLDYYDIQSNDGCSEGIQQVFVGSPYQ